MAFHLLPQTCSCQTSRLLPWVPSVITDERSHLKANNKLNLFRIFTKSLSHKGLMFLENKTQRYISWKILKSTSFTKATSCVLQTSSFSEQVRCGCVSEQTIRTALVVVSRYPENLLKFPRCWGEKRGEKNQDYEISKLYVYLLVFSSEYSGGVALRVIEHQKTNPSGSRSASINVFDFQKCMLQR